MNFKPSEQHFAEEKRVKNLLLAPLSVEDYCVAKSHLNIFPLRFHDEKLEKTFGVRIKEKIKSRCIITSAIILSAIALFYIIFCFSLTNASLILPKRGNPIIFYLCGALVSLLAISFAVIPRYFETKFDLEFLTLLITILIIILCCVPFQVLSNALSYSDSVTQAYVAKIWGDMGLSSIIVLLNIIHCHTLPTRSKTSVYVIFGGTLWITAIYIWASFAISKTTPFCEENKQGVRECEKPSTFSLILWVLLQSVFSICISAISAAAKYSFEVMERISFFKRSRAEARIQELVSKKLEKQTDGTAAVEEGMILIENALQLLGESQLLTKSRKLEEAACQLLDSLDILSHEEKFFQTKPGGVSISGADELTVVVTESLRQIFGQVSETESQIKTHSNRFSSKSSDCGFMSKQNLQGTSLMKSDNFVVRELPKELYYAGFQGFEENIFEKFREPLGTHMNTDILAIAKMTKQPLLHIGYILLSKTDLADKDRIDIPLVKFLMKLESLYFSNPYHNNIHAAMVAHMCLVFCELLDLFAKRRSERSNSMDRSLLVIAALCHDVGHPGRSNGFLIASEDPLATLYNDLSVLESYHCCLTVGLITREDYGIFSNVSLEEYRYIKRNILELILATDMSYHFDAISTFRIRKKNPGFNYLENHTDAWAVAKVCLKAADIGHSLVEWNQHYLWSLRIIEEFYRQGDEEARLNLPISPLCNRASPYELAKSQKGFLDFFVVPLLKELEDIDPWGQIKSRCLEQLTRNQKKWEELSAKPETVKIPENLCESENEIPSIETILTEMFLPSRRSLPFSKNTSTNSFSTFAEINVHQQKRKTLRNRHERNTAENLSSFSSKDQANVLPHKRPHMKEGKRDATFPRISKRSAPSSSSMKIIDMERKETANVLKCYADSVSLISGSNKTRESSPFYGDSATNILKDTLINTGRNFYVRNNSLRQPRRNYTENYLIKMKPEILSRAHSEIFRNTSSGTGNKLLVSGAYKMALFGETTVVQSDENDSLLSQGSEIPKTNSAFCRTLYSVFSGDPNQLVSSHSFSKSLFDPKNVVKQESLDIFECRFK